MATAIVAAGLAALVFLAVRRIHRKKLLTSCGGNCSACASGCAKRDE